VKVFLYSKRGNLRSGTERKGRISILKHSRWRLATYRAKGGPSYVSRHRQGEGGQKIQSCLSEGGEVQDENTEMRFRGRGRKNV